MDVSRTPVSSSSIASIGYSPLAVLEVEFRSGAVYRYFAVPRAAYEALVASESKGSYFNRNIRSRFSFQQICAAGAGR
jgi:hypothetical protein